MAYDASAYGGWVGGDDWRAWVGVTKGTETATSCQYTVSAWMVAGSGGESYYASNIQGWAGIWDEANGYRWTGAHDVGSFSPGDEWEFRSQTWTVSKSHSAQTVYFYSDVQASAGIYSGSESKATCTLSLPAKTSYRVTYNANGGSGAPSAQTKWHGESLTLSSTKPTRTGYTFKGWATSSSATTATYQPGDPYTGNAALALYAVWQANTYKVTFNANGGSGAPSAQTKTHGVAMSLNGWGSTSTTDAPTRTGHTFQGWATSSSATSATYTSSSHSYTDNKAVTLYAVWKAHTYTVAYNANGGSGEPSQQTKTYGVALTLRTGVPTRSGYAFKGWATSATGAVAYAAGGSYTANAAVTLYAVWQAQAPTLTISRAYRAKSTGAADDEGTYVHVFAKWTQAVSGSVTVTASLPSVSSPPPPSTTASGTSGTADLLIDTGDTLDGGTAYTVTVTATNSAGTTTKTYRLGTAAWPIDVLAEGGGIAFGGAATEEGLHSYMPAEFHDGLTASNIGTLVSDSASGVSVAHNTATALASVTLDAGTWVIEGNVGFASNATGVRTVNVSETSADMSGGTMASTGQRAGASPAGYTYLHTGYIATPTSRTTYYLNVLQTSGSALSTGGRMRAVRIR